MSPEISSDNLGKFEIHETKSDDEWDCWNETSPQGTIFTTSLFLKSARVPYRRFFVRKGNEAKAAFCLCESEDGRQCIADDLVIHTGLLFAKDSSANHSRERRMRFEITELAIAHLVANYDSIEWPLSPNTEDMRPFLWHNYHGEKEKQFQMELKYTSYLQIDELVNAEDEQMTSIFGHLEARRRRNIREAERSGATIETECPAETLLTFYNQVMADQGQALDSQKATRVKDLIASLTNAEKAFSFLARAKDGEPIYAASFACDCKCAYYLFGGGKTSDKKRYQGTFLFWKAFVFFATMTDIRKIDWEGVNSPQRGWFKLGFGGTLQPYYIAHWTRNK